MRERDALSLLATCVAGESLSEPWIGKVAVAWVVRNRVEARTYFGYGYHGVILKPRHFSCFNENDPVRKRLDNPAEWAGSSHWRECYKAAASAMFGFIEDPTLGANHYHTVSVRPYWSKGEKPTIQIGAHVFFKL